MMMIGPRTAWKVQARLRDEDGGKYGDCVELIALAPTAFQAIQIGERVMSEHEHRAVEIMEWTAAPLDLPVWEESA